jgi:anti-sigma factor RsiW
VTCREFTDFLMDYLSGELAPDARSSFDAHLQVCPNCDRYLTSYRESVELGKHAFEDEQAPVPSTVPEELVKAIMAARSRH